jgi:sterol desaturase/sphingolipid hydroxylase (fatty acid hydroxylase superfamily)
MHHSAERIDVPSAFMFSINDMIGLSLVGSVSFALIMGLAPQAITIIILTLTFLGIFQHANIRTPRWLGYIIQRPESHSIHHAKGVHKYNYTDLPIIDMIFGTFKNPKAFEQESGYYLGASNRILEMLSFRDVTSPKEYE